MSTTRLTEAWSSGKAKPEFTATAPSWLSRIGILNDYVNIPYANGSSFASQFFFREFTSRGHEVTVVGPRDPNAKPEQLPARHVSFPALPLRNHPGVYLPFPAAGALNEAASKHFDVALGQTAHELLAAGLWLRAVHDVPFLAVNTLHLPSVYNVVLPDALAKSPMVNKFCSEKVIPNLERHAADVYNHTDGLIVLSKGLEQYWRDRGVTVPIHVIPRAVEPKIFDQPAGQDPFPAWCTPGQRLLVVCRHTREKSVARLLEIFAREIAAECPDATLTLVGDGPDHDEFKALAKRLGVEDKTYFPGEFPVTQVANWYRHADLFVYPSLSETYGQVVSEAMWCGLPVVAFADGMGVSSQVTSGVDGYLVEPGPNERVADHEFAAHTIRLLRNPSLRSTLSAEARRLARLRSDPERCIQRYYDAFSSAREHCAATKQERASSPLATTLPLARWVGVHLAMWAVGLLRPPALLNRHGREQPSWDALPGAVRPIDSAKKRAPVRGRVQENSVARFPAK